MQAQAAGFSPQLLQYYIHKEMVERTGRGIFHIIKQGQPRSEHEDLIALWLWSKREGVFSHETALSLHDLVEGLPAQMSLTLPLSFRKRRLRLPPGSTIYYADVPPAEQCLFGPLALTTPLRTLVDCVLSEVDPVLVEQAIKHAVRRKLVTRARLQRALRIAQRPMAARQKVA
jgi:predicted transcriptional regulator of viral defense system